MSFVEGREMLGRLSRVCRLWRRVSEGERLCLPMVQKHMPCALLGGEESLHARLGGSARRCLQVHNASRTSRMVIPTGDYLREREVVLLTEVLYRGRLLSAMSGRPDGGICSGRGETYLYIGDGVEQSEVFSAASLGFDDIRTTFKCTTFNFGGVYVRFLAMDKTTGVVASLWQGRFEHDGQLPEYLEGMFHFTSKAEPVTSMSYNGPPLHAQVDMYIELAGGSLDDDEDVQSIHLDRERQWRISGSPGLALMGQPGVYGERFIRTRLAEEAMAAKQQGK